MQTALRLRPLSGPPVDNGCRSDFRGDVAECARPEGGITRLLRAEFSLTNAFNNSDSTSK